MWKKMKDLEAYLENGVLELPRYIFMVGNVSGQHFSLEKQNCSDQHELIC